MNVRKFFANTSRQALYQVRHGLGPDALILSNRAVDGGVEILAVAQGDLPPHAAMARTAAGERPDKAAEPGRGTPPAAPGPATVAAEDPVSRSLANEIKSMRGLIEEQLVYRTWDTAQRRDRQPACCATCCTPAGAALARQFAKMPAGLGAEQKLGWVKAVLGRNLRIVAATDEIVERGGVYALVGPTGVGKTTTVAKIAARCVVRFGADRLALLTTDGYRIGAHEQLRIYGKLLGVRVIAVKDASDLQFVLDDLRGKHLALIDTVGMSQRDGMVAEQLALLSASGTEVRPCCCSTPPATAKHSTTWCGCIAMAACTGASSPRPTRRWASPPRSTLPSAIDWRCTMSRTVNAFRRTCICRTGSTCCGAHCVRSPRLRRTIWTRPNAS